MHRVDVPQEDSQFVLDDRDTLQRLTEFKEYCQLIPFVDDKGEATDKTWGDVMFAKTAPEELVKLLNNPTLSDGKLQPHKAFLLAFYKLLETPRQLLNAFPDAHRQLYYRKVLGLTEHGMTPDQVVVSCSLTKGTTQLMLSKGLELDAGQDSQGMPKRYQLDAPVLANQGEWTDLRWVRRRDKVASGGSELEAGTQYAQISFDKSMSMPWPEGGVRLFELQQEESKAIAKQGRVVSSPVLAMSGGTRIVTVTFNKVIEQSAAVTVQLSSEGKWLTIDPEAIKNDGMTLKLTISPELGPINPAPGLDGYPTTGPMATAPLLKITRADGKPVPQIASIRVKVENLQNVLMSTDDGIAQINEKSYPFGLLPRTGSGFNLFSPDWYANPFAIKLTLTPQWDDLPKISFEEWYKSYTNKPKSNDAFVVKSGLCSASSSVFVNRDKSLFNGNELGIAPTEKEILVRIPPALAVATEPTNSLDPKDGPRWVRIELGKQDFLHREYPKALANSHLKNTFKTRENTQDRLAWLDLAEEAVGYKVFTTEVIPPPEINPPYTPQLKALKVDYSCTDNNLTNNQYLLTPFGYRKDADGMEDKDAKNPQLYLGFTGILPGQNINLYWQLHSPHALEVQWQYLHTDNVWKSFNKTVYDQSNGLFESGLWSSLLPLDASKEAPWMPSGRYWIRGVVTPPSKENSSKVNNHSPSSYPRLFGLHTNSTTATLVDGNSLEAAHFEQALPAFTITRTVKNIDGLNAIIQPWPSHGGRAPESTPEFLQRAAKHLKHRGRALTWRNITTLLHEKYPEVHDVRLAEPAPVEKALEYPTQRLVVIPANGKMDNNNSLKPVFNLARLERMTEFVRSIASPWLNLKLENPSYIEVKVTMIIGGINQSDYQYGEEDDDVNNESDNKSGNFNNYPNISYNVDFAAHVNQDYAQHQLEKALQYRYMPWGWDHKSVVKTGAHFDKFEMIKFIQQLDFVKRVNTLTIKDSQGQEQTILESSKPEEIWILTF